LQTNRELIKKEDGLAPLIKLIATNHPDLLVNVRSACWDPYIPIKIRFRVTGLGECLPLGLFFDSCYLG
jgi:hypothetical protein